MSEFAFIRNVRAALHDVGVKYDKSYVGDGGSYLQFRLRHKKKLGIVQGLGSCMGWTVRLERTPYNSIYITVINNESI